MTGGVGEPPPFAPESFGQAQNEYEKHKNDYEPLVNKSTQDTAGIALMVLGGLMVAVPIVMAYPFHFSWAHSVARVGVAIGITAGGLTFAGVGGCMWARWPRDVAESDYLRKLDEKEKKEAEEAEKAEQQEHQEHERQRAARMQQMIQQMRQNPPANPQP